MGSKQGGLQQTDVQVCAVAPHGGRLGVVLRPVRTGYRIDDGRRGLFGYLYCIVLLWRWSGRAHVVDGHRQHLPRRLEIGMLKLGWAHYDMFVV